MDALKDRPELGFYYHYKHDPAGPVNNYAYEVIGIGKYTEDDSTFFVHYLPLYEDAPVYKLGRFSDDRKVEDFLKPVEKDDKIFPRFNKITDPAIIEELRRIAAKMYSLPPDPIEQHRADRGSWRLLVISGCPYSRAAFCIKKHHFF